MCVQDYYKKATTPFGVVFFIVWLGNTTLYKNNLKRGKYCEEKEQVEEMVFTNMGKGEHQMEIYQLIKSSLDATELRSKTIANNIANINTPGYKRKYVTFEESLDSIASKPKIEVNEDKSTSMRIDGNNVDLENEKVNQAANSLMYNGLISITNIKLAMTKSVIAGR